MGAGARATALGTRSGKAASKLWAIATAISMVDLTTLEGARTPGKVRALCAKGAELPPVLAAHRDAGAIDLAGVPEELERELEEAAAGNVKRVLRRPKPKPDWSAEPSPARMLAFVEIKTVWHPSGV